MLPWHRVLAQSPDQGTKIPCSHAAHKKIRNPTPSRTSKSVWTGEKSVPWISVSPFCSTGSFCWTVPLRDSRSVELWRDQEMNSSVDCWEYSPFLTLGQTDVLSNEASFFLKPKTETWAEMVLINTGLTWGKDEWGKRRRRKKPPNLDLNEMAGDFPGGSVGQNLAASAGDTGSVPGSGRFSVMRSKLMQRNCWADVP